MQEFKSSKQSIIHAHLYKWWRDILGKDVSIGHSNTVFSWNSLLLLSARRTRSYHCWISRMLGNAQTPQSWMSSSESMLPKETNQTRDSIQYTGTCSKNGKEPWRLNPHAHFNTLAERTLTRRLKRCQLVFTLNPSSQRSARCKTGCV